MEVLQIQSASVSTYQKQLAKFRRRAQRAQVKVRRLQDKLDQANRLIAQQAQDSLEQTLRISALTQQVKSSEKEIESPVVAPFRDPNVFRHQFAASMVALCVNLSKIVSLRNVPKVLEMVLSAVGIQTNIPDRETVTRWCKRLGMDRLRCNRSRKLDLNPKDMIWIVDHSNQIGTQKVLVILGIPASKLPENGKTLTLDKLEVLAIEPGRSWNRDDVRKAYKDLAEKIGRPRWVLCDGAVELRESVDVLCNKEHTTGVLRDFKHVAANRFESMIGKSERFAEFLKLVGKTRCLVQQTELAHLTPPALKTKSRFMNIAPMITWASMMLGILENPTADEAGVTDTAKLNQRFGWLRAFTESIASWRRCCEIISWSLAWINTQGIEWDTADQLQKQLSASPIDRCPLSDRLTEQLLASIRESCSHVKEGERGWLSSESIESAFGLFKRRESQQSRSGFTGLLLTLPTLLRTWTADEVRTGLRRTSINATKEWTTKKLGATVWAKRNRAYRRFSPKQRQAFKLT